MDINRERISKARFRSKYVKMKLCSRKKDALEEEKDTFYVLLQEVLERAYTHDITIITGDIKAKLGQKPEAYKRVMLQHGISERNENDKSFFLLLYMSPVRWWSQETLFLDKDMHKQTWLSTDERTRKQIDHTNRGLK